MLTITLNRLAAALLGADAFIYWCKSRGGYWKAVGYILGTRVERDNPDPYQAIADVAQVAIEYGEVVAAETQARAAAKAAPAATEAADWPSTIRTAQDNARTMQRLASITGRASAAPAATVEEPVVPIISQSKKEKAEAKQKELVAWLTKNGGRQKWQVCRINIPDHLQGVVNGMVDDGDLIREYKTGRGFLGRYKRCYIRLKPKQKAN